MPRFTVSVCSRLVLVLSAMWLYHASAPAAEPVPHTKESLQKLYTDCLKELGYKPEVDEDGDVKVRIEGKTYFVYVRPDERHQLCLVSRLTALEKGADPLPVLTAATATNEVALVSTVYLRSNGVVVVRADVRVVKPEDARILFPVLIDRMKNAREVFEGHLAAPKPAGK